MKNLQNFIALFTTLPKNSHKFFVVFFKVRETKETSRLNQETQKTFTKILRNPQETEDKTQPCQRNSNKRLNRKSQSNFLGIPGITERVGSTGNSSSINYQKTQFLINRQN